MKELLAVAIGGSIGAVLRYIITNFIMKKWLCNFPWGTFAVNAIGCFFIGLLITLIDERELLSPTWRLFLCVGLLGGLTTFSTFSFESYTLLAEGDFAGLLFNIGGSIIVGIIFVWFGVILARFV